MKYQLVILGLFIVFLSASLASSKNDLKENNTETELTEAKDQTEKNLESSLAAEGEANRKIQ